MTAFVAGLLVMGYAVAGLYFLRFWRDTRDQLFAYFALAFLLLAVQRGLLAMLVLGTTWLYGLRLLAFVLLLAGIIAKNRARS